MACSCSSDRTAAARRQSSVSRGGAAPKLNWGRVALSSRSFGYFLPPPLLLLTCTMAPFFSGSRPRLVGRPLLYSISAFASLGVFLVSELCYTLSALYLLTLFSLDMIKGNASSFESESGRSLLCPSVMSGIITGPHFRQYFNSPGSLEVGTMVAVLEIGAFSTCSAFRVPYYVLSDEPHKSPPSPLGKLVTFSVEEALCLPAP